MLENGMFLIERYEILSKVGAGGMSDVYKAKDHMLGRIVAVKIMKTEFSEDLNFVTKFRSEAQSAAGLEHPNIVNIYDVGSENGLHFIVMEYVEGITLKTYIEKKGQLSFKEATSIAIQVARGIEAAHTKEIIHRDIKPQNIIISTEGKVKVTDFGIARALSSNTISAEVMGSVHYASPEQARNGFVDGRSDIYSLGIVMYEMVTGRVPFDGDTTVSVAIQHLQEEMQSPTAYAPELPVSYERIVLKATQKNPDRRYQSIEELLSDLRKALSNPEEDFVVIAPAAVAKTRVIGTDELEEIQSQTIGADLKSENGYASNSEEYDDEYDDEYYDEDYDEDYDDEEEEDTTGFLNPKMEKAVNIALIAVAILTVIAIIWLGSSVLGLLNSKPDPKPSGSDKETESASDSESESDSGEEESGSKEMVTMIDIVGDSLEKAKENLEAMGLKINVLTKRPEEGKAEGTILLQSVEKGEMVEKGSTIDVVIVGEETTDQTVPVPGVSGKGYDEKTAKQILSDAGFLVEVKYEYDDEAEKDKVFKQDPKEGTAKKKGTRITITISKGKAPVEVVVADYAGKPIDYVKLTLEKLGFVVNPIKQTDAKVDKDNVIKLEVDKKDLDDSIEFDGKIDLTEVTGTTPKVAYGATIDVYVSTGGEAVTLPAAKDIKDKDYLTVRAAIEKLSNKITIKKGEEASDTIAKDKVIKIVDKDGKDITGKAIAPDSEVTIVVSTGKATEMVKVPTGLTLQKFEDVEKTLKDLGFKVTKKDASTPNPNVNVGVVLEVANAGKEMPKGSTIEVTVNPAEKVTVPSNLVGKSKAEATSILEGLGLEVEYVEEYHDYMGADGVIAVEKTGETVEKGSTITLTISKGKAPAETDSASQIDNHEEQGEPVE